MAQKIEREKTELGRESTRIKRQVRKLDRNAPDFETFLEDVDTSPIDIDTGDLENDANEIARQEFNQIIRERKANDKFRFGKDTDFYLIICFQSNEQVVEFIKKAGWSDYGETIFNGFDIAADMGIEIKYEKIEPLPLRGNAKKYAPLALKPKIK